MTDIGPGGGAGGAGQPTQDTDLQVFRAAAACVTEIDIRYKLANINEKIQLKPERDKAFTEYSKARRKLLEAGVVTTAADVAEMQALKAEMDKAAMMQDFIKAAVKLVIFLAKMAAK